MKNDAVFRNTKQKNCILEVIKSLGDNHFTADTLIDLLKQNDLNIGRATVYRFLRQLEDMGELKKYFLHEGTGACFQYIGSDSPCNDHCHMICSSCGHILHIEDALLRQFSEKVKRESGFDIDDSRTVFYGICSECSSKS